MLKGGDDADLVPRTRASGSRGGGGTGSRDARPSSRSLNVNTPGSPPLTKAQRNQLEQVWSVIHANNGWNKVVSPEDVTPWISKLLQYTNNVPVHIDAPSVKGKEECPSTNGEQWPAYMKPVPDHDKALGQQWSITRKDYRGRNTKLFCYPKGNFLGHDYTVADPENQPVDLDLFTYTSSKNAETGLETLVGIIFPDNSITNVERMRAKVTDSVIKSVRNRKIEKAKLEAIDELAKIFSNCEEFIHKSRQVKEATTKKKAKKYINEFHMVALANIGLDLALDKRAHCLGRGEYKVVNGVDACVPTAANDKIQTDPDLLSQSEKDNVTQFLNEYVQKIVALQEKLEPSNVEETFANLTKAQKQRNSSRKYN